MSIARKQVVWFEEVTKHDVNLVGAKGANLGEMTNSHLPIPYGFIVTASAYHAFITASHLQPKIREFLAMINYDNPHELYQVAKHLQSLIKHQEIPPTITSDIIRSYEDLTVKEERYLHQEITLLKKGKFSIKHAYDSTLVAVRSSATGEDLPKSSSAGQQASYLNVKGESSLLMKIRDCWASLFTERAIMYRHEQKIPNGTLGIAVVVQRMVQSDKSGVVFSIDPVSGDKNKIVIEAILGLGEYAVQGTVTPDQYVVDKRSLTILNKHIHHQNVQLVRRGRENRRVRLTKEAGLRQKLSDEELLKLAKLTKDIETHYYFPQDVEWAIEGKRVFIVQSRPITTMT